MVKKKVTPQAKESDFGAGFWYPLALFHGHQMQLYQWLSNYKEMRENHPTQKLFSEQRAVEMWIYGAADHLMEFDPKLAPTPKMRELAKSVSERANKWRLAFGPDKIDLDKAHKLIEDCQLLFFMLDKESGNAPVKAHWN